MRAEQLEIPVPCHEDWDRMRADAGGQRRYCEQCERSVHDLSAMGEPAARAFLRANASRDVCIAYFEDEAGEIVFRPTRAPAIVPLSRLASAATIAMLLNACTPHGEPDKTLRVEDPATASSMVAPTTVIPTAASNQVAAVSEAEQPCEPRIPSSQRKKGKPKIKFGLRGGDPLGEL